MTPAELKVGMQICHIWEALESRMVTAIGREWYLYTTPKCTYDPKMEYMGSLKELIDWEKEVGFNVNAFLSLHGITGEEASHCTHNWKKTPKFIGTGFWFDCTLCSAQKE